MCIQGNWPNPHQPTGVWKDLWRLYWPYMSTCNNTHWVGFILWEGPPRRFRIWKSRITVSIHIFTHRQTKALTTYSLELCSRHPISTSCIVQGGQALSAKAYPNWLMEGGIKYLQGLGKTGPKKQAPLVGERTSRRAPLTVGSCALWISFPMTRPCWVLFREHPRPTGREWHPGRMNLYRRASSWLALAEMKLWGASEELLPFQWHSHS